MCEYILFDTFLQKKKQLKMYTYFAISPLRCSYWLLRFDVQRMINTHT